MNKKIIEFYVENKKSINPKTEQNKNQTKSKTYKQTKQI